MSKTYAPREYIEGLRAFYSKEAMIPSLARKIDIPFRIVSSSGSFVAGSKGDYIVRTIHGYNLVVSKAVFERLFIMNVNELG